MEEGREDRVTEVEGGESNDQHLFRVGRVLSRTHA